MGLSTSRLKSKTKGNNSGDSEIQKNHNAKSNNDNRTVHNSSVINLEDVKLDEMDSKSFTDLSPGRGGATDSIDEAFYEGSSHVSESSSNRAILQNCDKSENPKIFLDLNKDLSKNGKNSDHSFVYPDKYEEMSHEQKFFELRRQKRESMYFLSDPEKRIDFVLAFEQKSAKEARRVSFEENLIKAGLELEYENITSSSDGKYYYVKIHCPWETLINGAEIVKLKKKLGVYKEAQEELNKRSRGSCICCYPSKRLAEDEFKDYFTAPFDTSTIDIFDMPDKRTFFTSAERSLIANSFLDWTGYTGRLTKGNTRLAGIGISSLLNKGVYKAAFPLHEPLNLEKPKDLECYEQEDSDRDRLFHTWAHIRNIFRFQPLELIRKYFGEKVGIYFAWVGLYTGMLIPASLAGLAVFIYGLVTLSDDVSVNDICSKDRSPGNLTMCPMCDQLCDYQLLNTSCFWAKLTHLVDNYATIFISIFIAVWALVYLEMWKRKERELQYDWDVGDFETEEIKRAADYRDIWRSIEVDLLVKDQRCRSGCALWFHKRAIMMIVRPEYHMNVKTKRKNPITMQMEPYVPSGVKCGRVFTSITLVLFLTVIVVGSIFGVIVYRLMVATVLHRASESIEIIHRNVKLLTSVTSAIISLIVISILSLIYHVIAKALTNFELHRTQTEYEDAFIIKIIIFQFVNYYGSIFYIAFFKGWFVGPPGDKSMYLFGRKQDQCDPAGCFIEVSVQMAIIMVGKQMLTNAYEYFFPFIQNRIRSHDNKDKQVYMRWEQDIDLQHLGQLSLFYEYLELTIQFGFVTLFVASFPLAPLFALINNLLEIRLDATKFVKLYQRKPAMMAQDIGAWYDIMKALAHLSVVTNACIIAWTSDFIPKTIYMYNNNGSAEGYVLKTLTMFRTKDIGNDTGPDPTLFNITAQPKTCWYRDYSNDASDDDTFKFDGYAIENWASFTIRLAFIIVFEHVCYFLIFLVTVIIPDEPSRVKTLSRYERQLHHRLAYQAKYPLDLEGEDELEEGVVYEEWEEQCEESGVGDEIDGRGYDNREDVNSSHA